MKLALVLVFGGLAMGCSDPVGSGAARPDPNGSDTAGDGLGGGGSADMAGAPATDSGKPPSMMAGFSVVVTLLLENHDYKEIVGNTSDAPYLNSLIDQYGLATNYKDALVHPSLPNYLYMVSGSTQGLTSDTEASQITPFKVDNLGNQLEQAHIPWGVYNESQGTTPCQLSASGNYTSRHDPFLFFDGIQNGPNNLCAATNVDYGSFAADLAAGKKYLWITPNLVSDGHGGPLPIPFLDDPAKDLRDSDTWCKTEVAKIIDSPIFKAGGVLFITWDEAEGRNGNDPDQIPMIIVSPKLTKKTSATAMSHASYLATIEDLFGLPRLGAAVGAASLLEFFQ